MPSMFSYTAIEGSGDGGKLDGGRAGSWYTDAGTWVGIVRGKIIVGRIAMRKATTRHGVGDTGVRMEGLEGGTRDSP